MCTLYTAAMIIITRWMDGKFTQLQSDLDSYITLHYITLHYITLHYAGKFTQLQFDLDGDLTRLVGSRCET